MAAAWKAPLAMSLAVMFSPSARAIQLGSGNDRATDLDAAAVLTTTITNTTPFTTSDGQFELILSSIPDSCCATYSIAPTQTAGSYAWPCVRNGCHGGILFSFQEWIDFCVHNFERICIGTHTYEYVATTSPATTPVGGGASAHGDPHLQNVYGERFDLMKPGSHVLINIPKGKSAADAMLRVEAEAKRLGGCSDMYFQALNITGSWAEKQQAGGYHYSISQPAVEHPDWIAFYTVELKVVHGHTQRGIEYLNFYVKHLERAGFAVGGLLGDDDHTDASTVPASCRNNVALVD